MSATEEMWVTEVDPYRRTVVETSSRGTDHRTTFTVTPVGAARTELSMHFEAEGPEPDGVGRVVHKVLGAVGARATRRVMARDLGDIARRAEQAS